MFLAEHIQNQSEINFYDLEKKYEIKGLRMIGKKWSRLKLVSACRYLFLHRTLSDDFWRMLCSKAPSEAKVITQVFNDSEILFLSE